jgi:hypothetical protein
MSELPEEEEDEREEREPEDLSEPLEELAVADLPEDFPEVWLLVLEDGEEEVEPVVEPDFDLVPVEEPVRLLLPEVVDFEPVLLALPVLPELLVLPEIPELLLLELCVPPDIMEEEEPLMPDWFPPEVDFESEPESEVED